MKSQTMLLLTIATMVICTALLVAPFAPLLAISDNSSYVPQGNIVGDVFARQSSILMYNGQGASGVKFFLAGKDGQTLRTRGEAAPEWYAVGRMFKIAFTPPTGVGNEYGAVDNEFTRAPYLSFTPNIITATSAVVTAETVTAKITTQYASGDNVTVTHAFTDNSTYTFTQTELMTLYKDQTWLAEIQTQAKSSTATTSATITINVAGTEY